ncbi:Global transcription regulator sge1 [Elasticomyces elasticus]|nr:Global transcription regulator sge1 [Elasticomyces elasticus]
MSSTGGTGPLVPTFEGFVQNSWDGLMLFEACLSGKLHHVPRRPHDRERATLIKSGSIFIYEENASGIKRWTDGVAWSPSRILGNFLIYRELEKPFPPGEKKRAMKRKRSSLPGESCPSRDSDEAASSEFTGPPAPPTPPTPSTASEVKTEPQTSEERDMERQLIGSLVDSYGFRSDGLVKKTMSVSMNGVSHHLVSYYKVDDVKSGSVRRPGSDARLNNIQIRPDLLYKQNFRAPVEHDEHYIVEGNVLHGHPGLVGYPMGQYGIAAGQYYTRSSSYTMTTNSVYPNVGGTAWPVPPPPSSYGNTYGPQQAYVVQGYSDMYRTPQQPPIKIENQDTPYGHYGNSYQPASRNGSQSTYNALPPQYQQSPVSQQRPSFTASAPAQTPFGAGSQAQATYSSASGSSAPPSVPSQTPQMYRAASNTPSAINTTKLAPQQYPVQSLHQNYAMHSTASTPVNTVAQSPHQSLKSPIHATQNSAMQSHALANTDGQPQLSYRMQPYPGSEQARIDSLTNGSGVYGANNPQNPSTGMNSSSGWTAAMRPGGNSSAYSQSNQAFRPGESAAVLAQPYAQ